MNQSIHLTVAKKQRTHRTGDHLPSRKVSAMAELHHVRLRVADFVRKWSVVAESWDRTAMEEGVYESEPTFATARRGDSPGQRRCREGERALRENLRLISALILREMSSAGHGAGFGEVLNRLLSATAFPSQQPPAFPSSSNPDDSPFSQECAAAFVFFRTRFAAIVTSEVLQSSNPMYWVTDLAPEPHDVYWTFAIEIVTGYLPSVILQLFLYIVPPVMLLFSSVEGSISHSGRKKSACWKVLYFTIWNVFFVNVFSGSVISQLNVISSPKEIPAQLAKAVPSQATFFITYVLTSGWASLSSEVMQLFGLIWNFIRRHIFGWKDDPASVPSFPYHTEVPKVLLFGLLGFTCSVLAPLILPFLLVYFFLGYVVYRNQILNVYCTRYETGGQMWPIMHNTTIFSLVLSQIIAIGVFGIKESPTSSGFTILLVIFTLLFNEYCRQRFYPIFKKFSAQDLIEMDNEDERFGRLEEIHEQLHAAYCQFQSKTPESHDRDPEEENSAASRDDDGNSSKDGKNGAVHPTLGVLPVSRVRQALISLSFLAKMEGVNSRT
ncbi:hypothetical protein KSP40_PGU002391 [Platanthera guangdongensis]|uniref:CSC1/OSCA1-like 7TM region domain-containing protein n=1 Tax=Platanthera guangdongensis TaxID=2320717 RepID=A0ABR2MZD3_9ASPA